MLFLVQEFFIKQTSMQKEIKQTETLFQLFQCK